MPETLLAIDPGTKKIGWAFFSGKCLVRCGLSRVDAVDGLGRLALLHALNLPCAQKDLIAVATVGAAVASMKCDFVRYVPAREWKGQVPKDIHHTRILDKLTIEELPLASKANHDTLDAIGLGLFQLGR